MPVLTLEHTFEAVESREVRNPRDAANVRGHDRTGLEFDMTTVPAQKRHEPSSSGSRWPSWQVRFLTGFVVDGNGCHVWQRSRNSRGYGVIYFDGKLHLAHRASFFLRHGRWPQTRLVVDHVCENKACVNADHLRELTNSANILRSWRHLDPATEPLRVRQRAANARYRAKMKGGE